MRLLSYSVGVALAACASPLASTTGDARVVVPTYHRDVAPILNSSCVSCHAAGGLAPMSLRTYNEVAPEAQRIARATTARTMPPWPAATSGCRPIRNTQALRQVDIDTLALWANSGAFEGDPSHYVARPDLTEGRVLPEIADAVLMPDTVYQPNLDGQDDYRCFVMDPQLLAARDVIGLRITPGNAALVHHALVYEVRAQSLAELDALDRNDVGEGYRCFGGTGIPVTAQPAAGAGELAAYNQQGVGGWAPGSIATYFPDGTGIRLASGSRLVLQVHYAPHTAVTDRSDRTRVELFYAATPIASPGLWSAMYNATFRVPTNAAPSDPTATVHQSVAVAAPLQLFGVAPHMHFMGTEIRVDVVHGDGSRECLVQIPQWDFHWQRSYWFAEPLQLVANANTHDTFELTCVYDNTPENQPIRDGRPGTSRPLIWGESSDDEMCLAFLYMGR